MLNIISKIIISMILVLFAHHLMAQKEYTLSDNHSLPLTYKRIKKIKMLRAADYLCPKQSDNYSLGIENSFAQNSLVQKFLGNKMNGVETSSNNQVYRCDTAMAHSINDTVRFIPSYNANGRVTVGLVGKWSNGQWIDLTKDTLTFDSKGHILIDLKQVWSIESNS